MAASAEGTQRFAERTRRELPPHAFRALGPTGLTVSALGFGTYRVDERTPHQSAALRQAIASGINLIDTSTNYMDGSSERAIGAVLREVPRDEIVVISKAGYVQGQAMALARTREAEGKPFPEMVKYMDGCWHCIHPEFLADQLTRSLGRLQIPRVDVYLLHNPEYFFADAAKKRARTPTATLRAEFYDRIARAFAHLESEVSAGRIAWYGVSSNSFGDPDSDPEATSIERMLEIAKGVANPHHFAVVQLPANLFETGPMLTRNNAGGTQSALAFTAANKLAALVNRPVNAYRNGKLTRLADAPGVPPASDAISAAAVVLKLEAESPGKRVAWGQQLMAAAKPVQSMSEWLNIEAQVRAQSKRIADAGAHLTGAAAEQYRSWLQRYAPALEALLSALGAECAARGQEATRGIHARLNPFLPPAWQGQTLSRKAMAVLVNTPGVTCVLNGMRRPEYVTDALGALAEPQFAAGPELFDALGR